MADHLRDAARMFWPNHADLIYDTFDRLNRDLFDGELVNAGIVVGLTPHGGRLGSTALGTGRITLHPALLDPATAAPWGIPCRQLGERFMADTLLHEMVHAVLIQHGEPHDHNDHGWCGEVTRISPLIGLGRVIASPWKRARRSAADGGGLTYRPEIDGSISRTDLATWPQSLRPHGYYAPQPFPAVGENTRAADPDTTRPSTNRLITGREDTA